MEKEFLLGIDFGLYVDKSTYDSWLNLLQGLVMAKERELQHWRRSRRPARSLHRVHPIRHSSSNLSRPQPTRSHRARSTSPRRCPAALHPGYAPSVYYVGYRPEQASSTKRTASEAFSNDSSPYVPAAPTSEPPRRSAGLTLQIPELEYSSSHSSESSASPLEPLQGFSKLSLGASPVNLGNVSPWASTIGQNEVPQTLVSAYRRDERHPYATPEVSPSWTCTAPRGLTYHHYSNYTSTPWRARPHRNRTASHAKVGFGTTSLARLILRPCPTYRRRYRWSCSPLPRVRTTCTCRYAPATRCRLCPSSHGIGLGELSFPIVIQSRPAKARGPHRIPSRQPPSRTLAHLGTSSMLRMPRPLRLTITRSGVGGFNGLRSGVIAIIRSFAAQCTVLPYLGFAFAAFHGRLTML